MRLFAGVLMLVAIIAPVARSQQPMYLDPSQFMEKRVEDLTPRLTLEGKASLLCTTAPAIERLKFPVMNGWNQSLHGIVWTRSTAMFPVNIGMAATWNVSLIRQVASAIADEGRAVYNLWPTVSGKTEPGGQGQLVTVTANGERLRHNGLVYRSPVINISRDPRRGRIHEAFGEDPHLTSRMAVASVPALGMTAELPEVEGDFARAYLYAALALSSRSASQIEPGHRSGPPGQLFSFRNHPCQKSLEVMQ